MQKKVLQTFVIDSQRGKNDTKRTKKVASFAVDHFVKQ